MSIDYRLHIFHSPQFESVVHEAIDFFNETPVHRLPIGDGFVGSGIYALYYLGDFQLYTKISNQNQETQQQSIYAGKAVPPGWRTARSKEKDTPVLFRRLQEHTRSIRQATNLKASDFCIRFVILGGIEGDLVVPVEAEMIRRYAPLWNSVVDGFGNHDPGSGRYNQAKSEWDVLHPGRPLAERLTGESPSLERITERVQQALDRVP